MKTIEHTIISPDATVIVFNYKDRLGFSGISNADRIERKDNASTATQEVITLSSSLISISTSKQKGSPVGTFQLQLAPTAKWSSRITPGSWVCILMTRDANIENIDLIKAHPTSLKMVGRIDSVRQTVSANNTTGARQTIFTVDGKDWGCIFESSLYIDKALASVAGKGEISSTLRLLFDNILDGFFQGDEDLTKLLSTSNLVSTFIKLWGGSNDSRFSEKNVTLTTGAKLKNENAFLLPDALRKFLQLDDSMTNFGSAIELITGKLIDTDKYEDTSESFTNIQQEALFGMHTLWQLISSHCNPILNEAFCDGIWEDGKFKFATYKRIKPFGIRGKTNTRIPTNIYSDFKYIKYHNIALEDILTINLGTNWSDRINFVEVLPQPNILRMTDFSNQLKLESQVYDQDSIQRDGFKPLVVSSRFLPTFNMKSESINKYREILQWKYALQEWYFTTHMMLNGTMVIVGQNQSIGVGDNVRIPIEAVSDGGFTSTQTNNSYLLMHVESIGHRFTVSQETGARSFMTDIKFVRGIVVDSNNNVLGDSGALADSTEDVLNIEFATDVTRNNSTILTETETKDTLPTLTGESL